MPKGSFSHVVLDQYLEKSGLKKIFEEYDEPDKEEYVTGHTEMSKSILMQADGDLKTALGILKKISDRACPPSGNPPSP